MERMMGEGLLRKECVRVDNRGVVERWNRQVPPTTRFKLRLMSNTKTYGSINHTTTSVHNNSPTDQFPAVIPAISFRQLLQNAISGTHSFPNVLCDAADSFITCVLTPLSSTKPSMDPYHLLFGICSSVPETPPTPCRILYGSIPTELYGGVYLRNGPNATSIHIGDSSHMFDGDGMLHSVSFQPDPSTSVDAVRPIYCSRFVQTSRFRQEQEAGRPLFPKVFGGVLGVASIARWAVTLLRSMLGLLDLGDGCGLSNTNVCYFNGHILSLSEDDLPYVIRLSDDGDLSTVGRFTLPSKYNMCAHPKHDPLTGDMYAFSLNLPFFPPYSLFRLSASDGSKSPDLPLPLQDIPLLHDFAMTPRFFIFPEHQILMRPWRIANGAMPIVYDSDKTSRFCLFSRETLDRPAGEEAMCFDSPGINCLHLLNAWEDEEGGDEIVIVAPTIFPADRILAFTNVHSILSEIKINRRTGEVSTREICCPAGAEGVEFGVINPNYAGKRTRYAYTASGSFPHMAGVVKVDLSRPRESSIVAERNFVGSDGNGGGYYGGEPCFVPAKDAVSEDHGYLLCFVGKERSQVSELLIMDARSPSLEVIASVEMPSRVPPGLHGCFVTAEQLAQQR